MGRDEESFRRPDEEDALTGPFCHGDPHAGPQRDEEDGKECIGIVTVRSGLRCEARIDLASLLIDVPDVSLVGFPHCLGRRIALASPKVAFIKQEALEKAREIKVKADEEFAIEKVSEQVQ